MNSDYESIIKIKKLLMLLEEKVAIFILVLCHRN